MYPILLAFALVLSAPAPWVKGDTVFVSATLTHVDYQATLWSPFKNGSAQSVYELPACTPIEIRGAFPDKPVWSATDAAKGSVVLKGDWTSRMHRTREACLAALASLGEPTVIHSLYKHQIIP